MALHRKDSVASDVRSRLRCASKKSPATPWVRIRHKVVGQCGSRIDRSARYVVALWHYRSSGWLVTNASDARLTDSFHSKCASFSVGRHALVSI